MLLSKETTIQVTDIQSNIIGHLGHSAYKLWNTLKYERDHWQSLGLTAYPDWYYQKKAHKDDLWYKSLPSQTAQEVCKLLDKSYKSYFALLKTGGIENPHPPKFKHENMPVTYMQNGIAHTGDTVRLSLSKSFKQHMSERFDIHENYLYLKNKIFENMEHIKQLKLYMPEQNVCRLIAIYEIPDVQELSDNGRYLSIDMGVHNMLTTYDNVSHASAIYGRRYSEIIHYYDKKIAHYLSISDGQQSANGIRYPKKSKRVLALYRKKRNTVHNLLHKVTKQISDYCVANDIHTVIIGDLTGIRKDNDLGTCTNQKFHQLPYKKLTELLTYKLALQGIRLIKISEAYSSQTAPSAPLVSKQYATPKNREKRGLYVDGKTIYNADAVGAYNILRLYLQKENISITLPYDRLCSPKKVAV